MSGEHHHHHSPLDKLHLPWKRHNHNDDVNSVASEKQPLNPSTPSTKKITPPQQQHYGSFASNARLNRVWDVKMPPAKKTMVHGVLVPTMGGTLGSKLIQRKRRIVIEIHSDDFDLDAPCESLLRGDSFQGTHDNDVLGVEDKVIVRILKPSKSGANDESSDEGDYKTISTIGFHAAEEVRFVCVL